MAISTSTPMTFAPKLPDPNDRDSEQVLLCLQTAERLVKNGDLHDAIRWLRRGAEAAEQDGDDERAAALARAAAELSGAEGSLQPPLPAPPATASSAPAWTPPPPSALRAARAQARASAAPPASLPPPPPVRDPARAEANRAAPAQASRPAAADASQLDALLAQGLAVRVSIKRSARDPELYVVRRLDPNKPLPFGVRSAVLLLNEADPEFLSEAPANRRG